MLYIVSLCALPAFLLIVLLTAIGRTLAVAVEKLDQINVGGGNDTSSGGNGTTATEAFVEAVRAIDTVTDVLNAMCVVIACVCVLSTPIYVARGGRCAWVAGYPKSKSAYNWFALFFRISKCASCHTV